MQSSKKRSKYTWDPIELRYERPPKNPRNSLLHKYNPLSRSLFCWIDSLVFKGFRHELKETDLYAHPSEADSEKLSQKFQKYWNAEQERAGKQSSPRLWLAIAKCFSWRIFLHGIVSFLVVLALIGQPVILGYLTNYFAITEPTQSDTHSAYLFALALSSISFLLVFLNGLSGYSGYKLGMLVRVIATSAIYKKIVELRPSRISQLTVGHIINLASNDVHRFDQSLLFYHYLWIGPIHLVIVTAFVYVEIGPTAFLAAFLVIIQLPLQHYLGRIFIKLRLNAAKLTDKRVLTMNEVINGIRVIKMYGWEYAFHQVVSSIRRLEVKAILKSSVIRVINLSYYDISLPLILLIVFSVYVSIDENNVLTSKKVFTTLSLLSFVRLISLKFLVSSVIQISEGRVALKRISDFLLINDDDSPTHETTEENNSQNESPPISPPKKSKLSMFRKKWSIDTDSSDGYNSLTRLGAKPGEEEKVEELTGDDIIGVLVKDLHASWTNEEDLSECTLLNISFKVDMKSPLFAIVGPIGAGKSTLLQCLLKELPPFKGSVTMRGTVVYVSQEPWIFSSTVRENILFGSKYEDDWYYTVLEACALKRDIDCLINGDLTLVGERGVTLSGGQKARVSLARAVYRKADIYLLDDPLSAVDTAVSRHLFNKCIKGLLSQSCVLLVTHQLQYLKQCDKMIGLKEGVVTVYGDTTEILEWGESKILSLIGGKGGEEEEEEYEEQLAEMTFSDDDITPLHSPLEENILFPGLSSVYDSLVISNSVNDDTPAITPAPPPLLSALSTRSFGRTLRSITSIQNGVEIPVQTFEAPPEEESTGGTVSVKTYAKYFMSGGSYWLPLVVLIMFLIAECSIITTDWWIADWANCNINGSTVSTCALSNNERIGIYSGLVSSLWISCLLRSFLFYVLSLSATRTLHNRMFSSVIRAPVLFFDTNPIGRVLNRFSKDIGFLDDILIYSFCEFLQFFMRFLGIIITAVIANYYLIIVIVILCVVFVLFRQYYLRMARTIKRIEASRRSPLYSHISMTLQGLSTIRAYGMVQEMVKVFYNYHNKHTQAWFLYIVSSRWFGMRIDALSSLFITTVVFVSIPLAGSLSPGLVGLALFYAISLNGMFQYCMRLSAEVENLMVSAERVIAYGEDLPSEAPFETDPLLEKPPSTWPESGRIELKDLTYRHSETSPLVLKGLSAVIGSGEKIGIVGRTGAGKSSLASALFRLAEPNGSIKIDDVEVLILGLHDLRRHLSIIPQDPVLFTGTVRYNLDPFGSYDDGEIWRSLEQVQLKWSIELLDEGLEAVVTEGGSNFSVGQRQLFCLARALLRRNKILILDEATANVDLETDAIIQQVIREQFSQCTILTIAHRLETVMDSDRIMVLRFGEIAEFNEPHVLLSKPNSYLLRLVEHTGPGTAAKLKEIATDTYNMKHGIRSTDKTLRLK